MHTRFLGGLALALSLPCAACGDSSGTGAAIDCETATVKTFDEISGAFSKCTSCHDSALVGPTDRQAAPDGVNYDTCDGARAEASAITSQINDGLMPPSDQPQLSDTEKTDILTWAACGSCP